MTTPETHPNYRPPLDIPNIKLEQNQNPSRQKIPKFDEFPGIFIVSNLLSATECSQLIECAEKQTLKKVDWEYDPKYRDCSRVVVQSSQISNIIYDRILPLLSRRECENVRPFGFDGQGDWRPLKVNDVIRISRYDENGHFSPHRDGAFVENDDLRSVYTVLVYLNEPPMFRGGQTHIFSSDSDDTFTAVEPSIGNALVMLHDTLHSGNEVISGFKYIARFDIMFHRLGGSMTESQLSQIPDRAVAEKLYASSITKQRNGDPEGSTKDYVEALNLQAKLPSSTHVDYGSNPDGLLQFLNEHTFFRCLRFMTPKEIASVSSVSKRWKELSSSGMIWRELFVMRWPALVCAESAIHPQHDAPPSSNTATFDTSKIKTHSFEQERDSKNIFATILPSKPDTWLQGKKILEKELYDASEVPRGYMFCGLSLTEFTSKKRSVLQWSHVSAAVNKGIIHIDKNPEALARRVEGKFPSQEQIPPDPLSCSIPIFSKETEIFYGYVSDRGERSFVDSCIIKIPGSDGKYLAICKDPHDQDNRFLWWFPGAFHGIFEDIARVEVARQTERALRHEDVSVVCDSKTKQWKTAFIRRHLAERLFDVVTIDVGSMRTKFLANSKVTDIFHKESRIYKELSDCLVGAEKNIPKEISNILLHPSQITLDDIKEAVNNNEGLHDVLPLDIFEAIHSCGSFQSIVSPARGHLWSAGHGLENHVVGNHQRSMFTGMWSLGNDRKIPFKRSGSDGSISPNVKVIGIICAHVVDNCFAARPQRSADKFQQTCAENPINLVEPPQGFTDEERSSIIETLSTWGVPYVGFVNSAAAALMCGENPKKNGIVVMLGGMNSAVTVVMDGNVVVCVKLESCVGDDIDDDQTCIIEEVCMVVEGIITDNSFGKDENKEKPQVLMTGGRATDDIVSAVKTRIIEMATVYVTSHERERHLDSVRGAHILANLSDGRKHFISVMSLKWGVEMGNNKN